MWDPGQSDRALEKMERQTIIARLAMRLQQQQHQQGAAMRETSQGVLLLSAPLDAAPRHDGRHTSWQYAPDQTAPKHTAWQYAPEPSRRLHTPTQSRHLNPDHGCIRSRSILNNHGEQRTAHVEQFSL